MGRRQLEDRVLLSLARHGCGAGIIPAPACGYRAAWYRFDNETGASLSLGESASPDGERIEAPAHLPGDASFNKIAVSAVEPRQPSWAEPVEVYFRRTAGGWKLVGLFRVPESP